MKTNKELQNYENTINKLKKENQELKSRNKELELVLKEILFEKECNRSNAGNQKNHERTKTF